MTIWLIHPLWKCMILEAQISRRIKLCHKAFDGQCAAAKRSGYCRFALAMAPIIALCVWAIVK